MAAGLPRLWEHPEAVGARRGCGGRRPGGSRRSTTLFLPPAPKPPSGAPIVEIPCVPAGQAGAFAEFYARHPPRGKTEHEAERKARRNQHSPPRQPLGICAHRLHVFEL